MKQREVTVYRARGPAWKKICNGTPSVYALGGDEKVKECLEVCRMLLKVV